MNTYPERVNSILEWTSLDNDNNAQKNRRYCDSVLEHLQNNPTIVYAFISVLLAQFIINSFGLYHLSLSRVLWNVVVYFTPFRIVVALDPKMATMTTRTDSVDMQPKSDFQAKSEAMQRIIGIDNNNNNNNNNDNNMNPPSPSSLYSLFSPARTFSGIVGNALLGGGSRDNVPPGLGNWDNSCYQNSIIQGLASLRSLAEFLEGNIRFLADGGSFATHQALKDIIERLNSPSNHDQKLWIPAELKSMCSWQQQDAQEYFSKVVDQIDREILQVSRRQTRNLGLKIAGPEEHVIGAVVSELKKADETWNQMSVENSSLRNPLEGLLAQRVGCMKCGWTEGLSLIPFNCLTVPLGGIRACDIRDCLDQYMTLESIEGVECAKCTLLRARDQLRNLLKQIEGDKEISNSAQSPNLSEALMSSAQSRLQAVEEALEEEDFADKTLSSKCHIPAKNRMSTTKSRQAVIARAPQCLVIHINRSLFDENTGMLRKNYAEVRFPKTLDLGEWCLGSKSMARADGPAEKWNTNPNESMLPSPGTTVDADGRRYELRALITHYGRHENGHYICYRKYPSSIFPAHVPEAVLEVDGEEKSKRWFRLSDDDVQMVSEQHVMAQGGGFMLFYEAVERDSSLLKPIDMETPQLVHMGKKNLESISSFTTPDDMSTASTDALTQDDTDSNTSRTPSASPPLPDRVIPPIEDIQQPAFSILKMGNVVDGGRSDDRGADGIPSSPSIVTAM